MKSRFKVSIDSSMSLTKPFGWGQNFGHKSSHLHFEDDICEELNCLNLNPVKMYVGSAASREAYLENVTNGCCGD